MQINDAKKALQYIQDMATDPEFMDITFQLFGADSGFYIHTVPTNDADYARYKFTMAELYSREKRYMQHHESCEVRSVEHVKNHTMHEMTVVAFGTAEVRTLDYYNSMEVKVDAQAE